MANRGVYFFFEGGELRSQSGSGGLVVRIGTHAVSVGSKSTLWGRLAQHRGSLSGNGNHRGSIFRLWVGSALLCCQVLSLLIRLFVGRCGSLKRRAAAVLFLLTTSPEI
jgi:hypothetical protein